MLVVGVALAVVSFVAVLALGGIRQQVERKAPPQPDVNVVVAAVDLPLGVQVTADSLTTVTKPQSQAA